MGRRWYYGFTYLELIFNHGFAEVFFGDDWKFGLQAIVLKKEPLKFLEEFLDIDK